MGFPSDFQARAIRLDETDDLAGFRREFQIVPGQIYLDGNSLGLISRSAERAVLRAIEQWKSMGIEGWTKASPSWLSYSEQIAGLLAPMMGAAADEIAVANSTTVNLHQLLSTLFEPRGHRSKILVDELCFPSDRYAIESHLRLRQLDPREHLVIVPSRDGFTISETDIVEHFSQDIQLAMLPSVLFQSGQLLDMERLSGEAHRHGVMIGFDCSHSAGVVPHQFDAWGTDFAFWCTYKYLNSGPGGTAAIYLNKRHFGRAPGMAGWFGCRKDRQFCFSSQFEPAATAKALEIGTPNILSMAPLLGSLEQIGAAGIDRVRRKSVQLTEFLIELLDQARAGLGFELATPRDPSRRGGHVSLLHADAARICIALRQTGVVTDLRPPSMIRITPSPLFTSFSEVFEAMRLLHKIVAERSFDSLEHSAHVI